MQERRARQGHGPFERAGRVGVPALLVQRRAEVGVRGRVFVQRQGPLVHLRRLVEPFLLKERTAEIVVRARVVRREVPHALELGDRGIQPVDGEVQRPQTIPRSPVAGIERHGREEILLGLVPPAEPDQGTGAFTPRAAVPGVERDGVLRFAERTVEAALTVVDHGQHDVHRRVGLLERECDAGLFTGPGGERLV